MPMEKHRYPPNWKAIASEVKEALDMNLKIVFYNEGNIDNPREEIIMTGQFIDACKYAEKHKKPGEISSIIDLEANKELTMFI